MCDYLCGECGWGFPERGNRVRVNNVHWLGDPASVESRLQKWVLIFNNSFISAFKTAYYVKCPKCGTEVR